MNEYDIKRLALVFAVQAEIDARKFHNVTVREFWDRADQLRELAYKHNEQL